MEDIFAIQDEIAKNIVRALEAKLSKKEKHILEKTTTQNIQAYDFYIRGRAYSRMMSAGKTPLAVQMFEKAIQKDPGYALAYAGLADTYTSAYLWFNADEQMMELADKASQKALELDPELAGAYVSRGLCLSTTDRYDEAEVAFETAISLNPQLFDAYYQYGRTAKAQGKNRQAAGLFEKVITLQPENYEAAVFLTGAYCDLGMEKEVEKSETLALTAIRNHVDLNPEDIRALYLGANIFARSGKSDEAVEWIERALSIGPDEPSVLYNATCCYSLLGDHERALDLFERRAEIGLHRYREWIRNDTDLDPLRDHPRFQKAFAKLK
jgi:adenylate cyclase